jgi:hypothetical protein
LKRILERLLIKALERLVKLDKFHAFPPQDMAEDGYLIFRMTNHDLKQHWIRPDNTVEEANIKIKFTLPFEQAKVIPFRGVRDE